ncbi:MAG: tRNA-binding protein, partial [Deltaproteobacteria bacterium]|nr:tRNA-binding protein [Deltaproteobacteria bacterium]
MAEITFNDFKKLEIRTGTIIDANLNHKAIKPSYKLIID